MQQLCLKSDLSSKLLQNHCEGTLSALEMAVCSQQCCLGLELGSRVLHPFFACNKGARILTACGSQAARMACCRTL